jgi:pyruvate dehydrogenase (quinone)
MVSNPAQMPRVLEIAIRRAVAERCVCVLVIPGDVALRPASDVPAPPASSVLLPPPTVTPPSEAVGKLAELLNSSKGVTLLCGGGCEGAHGELMQLAGALQARIVHAMRGSCMPCAARSTPSGTIPTTWG